MRNLYGGRAGWKTINNRLLPRGYQAYRPTRKPMLTANHRCLCLEWAQRWQNLTMAYWQHVIFGDGSRVLLYLHVSWILCDRFYLELQCSRFWERLVVLSRPKPPFINGICEPDQFSMHSNGTPIHSLSLSVPAFVAGPSVRTAALLFNCATPSSHDRNYV